MGHRIAKIHQYAITEVLGQIAVKPVNHLGTGLMVGTHHLPQVFWVQVPRQRGRADQVAEQHGETAAFRLRRRQGLWQLGCCGWHWLGGDRHRDRRYAGVFLDGRQKAIPPP
jgi:hypothetical protein